MASNSIVDQRMGGKPLLRIAAQDSPDIRASLLPRQTNTETGVPRLGQFIRERSKGSVDAEIRPIRSVRCDVLLQRLRCVTAADALRSEARQVGISLFDEADELVRQVAEDVDVIALSIMPDLLEQAWRHHPTGLLVQPLQQWEQSWSGRQVDWFRGQFEPAGLMTAQEFAESHLGLVRALKERSGTHLIVFNASPLDPKDQTHNYHGASETISLRIQSFNLELIRQSILEGVSIVDCERLVAELGEQHVRGVLQYSASAYQDICSEFVRILDDIGFFQAAPLLPQVGRPVR